MNEIALESLLCLSFTQRLEFLESFLCQQDNLKNDFSELKESQSKIGLEQAKIISSF